MISDRWDRTCVSSATCPKHIDPLLFHLAGVAEQIYDMHFMLQKEVVERMVATPGESAFSRLSVMLQYRFWLEWLIDVPPESFDPPPKVDSAVVRMIPCCC